MRVFSFINSPSFNVNKTSAPVFSKTSFASSSPATTHFCFEIIFKKFGEQFFDFKNHKDKKNEKIFFNFKQALASLLPENTDFDPRSTFEDENLASHRRDKNKNRNISIRWES